jgi:CRP/FNR family transcriptional regulator, anaerobic regulatory protein
MVYEAIQAGQRLRRYAPCAFCVVRHKGLCSGIDAKDFEGSSALESAHAAIRIFDEGEAIYAAGDHSDFVFNLISGWVVLHRDLPDGRRQIVKVLQPGSLFGMEPAGCDLNHGATAITEVSVCPIGRTELDQLRSRVSALNEHFILMLERDNNLLFHMQAMIGQCNAKERISALLTYLVTSAGAETTSRASTSIQVPLTQRQIGEATGLSAAYVNRTLRRLREDGVFDFRNGTLTVMRPVKLQSLRAWRQRMLPAEEEAAVAPSARRAFPRAEPPGRAAAQL